MKYHLKQVRMAHIKNTANNLCWQGNGEKRTHIHCWWEGVLFNTYEKQYTGFSVNSELSYYMTQKFHFWIFIPRTEKYKRMHAQ